MHFVYVLVSKDGQHHYMGITTDIERRLDEHNNGKSIHTNKFRPWRIETFFAFADKKKAEAFKIYLKSHSGRAFSAKHF